MAKKERTYMLERSTVDWVDNKAEEEDTDKSDVVNRAIRYYAAMLSSDNGWSDEYWSDSVDDAFERNVR